jgi:ribosomal protein S18 acetylase RimI-like enzyme
MEFRPATASDLDGLIRLQADFYREDGYVHRVARAREAWITLLNDKGLGEVWLVEAPDGLVGYVVVTFSYSLEFLGRDAFVDELFVASAFRRQGLGRAGLRVAESICRQAGVRAVHLEVEHGNESAARLYQSWGFANHNRALMTKWLEDPS